MPAPTAPTATELARALDALATCPDLDPAARAAALACLHETLDLPPSADALERARVGIARERSTYRSAYGHEPQVWARLTAMADHAADLPDLVQRLLRGAEHLYELTTNSAWNTCLRATLQARHPGLSVRAVDRRIRTLAEHERHRRAEQSQVI